MGYTRTRLREISVTPTVDTSAYATLDRVGTVMTFTLGQAAPRSCRIVAVRIEDYADQAANLNLHLYKVSPVLTNADNGAYALTDAEAVAAKYIDTVSIVAADYADSTDNRQAQVVITDGIPVCADTGAIYGALQNVTTTPTYAATSLTVTITIQEEL